MQPRRLLVVYLLVGLVSYTLLLAYGKDEGEAITEEAITVDQQKVHQECRNPDYKQYLKCLMRPKRHHHTDRGDTSPETDTAFCLEGCLNKCDRHVHDCEKKCCTKRIRYKFITEFEKECESGKCVPVNDAASKTTNITTNIGIHNVINTSQTNTSTIFPPIFFPFFQLVPQISLVPQITYGLGFGAMGGCAYNQWFCFQQAGFQIPQKTVSPDCSGCGIGLYYRCDVSCYAVHANMTINAPCRNPSCGST
ncbi:hypothetical protein HN011_002654 [Eciton burchellii]|nr:hypothetical protein HN011_002654 [Eciton burchellii]